VAGLQGIDRLYPPVRYFERDDGCDGGAAQRPGHGVGLASLTVRVLRALRTRTRPPISIPPQQAGATMTLTNFKVNPTVEVDGALVVIADDGDTRVVAFIERVAIDDSFPQHHLTDDERVGLVGSHGNLAVISRIISAKYARGETQPYHRFGSTLPLVEIGKGDLKAAPPLSEDYLLVARGAGYKARP
jgi:hypothetical protein